MILSDKDMKKRLEDGSIVIDSILDPDLQIQPASIDLRLADEFVIYNLSHMACIDPNDPTTIQKYTRTIHVAEGEPFILHPGEFALGSTAEWVEIPPDLVARVEGRSSIGRIAVVVHATAGFIDPGFKGRITLELSNLGRVAVKLYPGMRISQLVFHTMTSPAERPYGPERGSKYYGQTRPEASRLANDPDSGGFEES